MRPNVLKIPRRRKKLAAWLEKYLFAPELPELIAELEALRGPGETPRRSLEAVLGEDLQSILADGFSALSMARLRELLRRPQLLLELQERVFVDGGPYWREVRGTSPAFERILQKMQPVPPPPKRWEQHHMPPADASASCHARNSAD